MITIHQRNQNVSNDDDTVSIKGIKVYGCFPFHQRNQNVSNDDDTVSKSTQNSLRWVLPDKYITDWHTIQFISNLLILLSLFLPSTNMSLSEECNVLYSLMSNNSPMNRFSMLNILPDVKIPVLSISLFSAKSGQTLYRKVPCFANKVLEWYKHVFQFSLNLHIHLMTRSELQFS